METTYTFRCGHPAEDAPPVGTAWLYDCPACRQVRAAEAKARVGWAPGPVYTVLGEMGNNDGPYTGELLSLEAALEAIRTGRLPLAPIGDDGGLRLEGSRVRFMVRRELCYAIVEHEPATASDPITGWSFGGLWNGRRCTYRLADGTARVVVDDGPSAPLPEDRIPTAWREYRERLRALPPRGNYSTVYRDVLGVQPEEIRRTRKALP